MQIVPMGSCRLTSGLPSEQALVSLPIASDLPGDA